ncbi:MAG: hypothetical protein UV02_C0042G0009 [Candidatus Kuenenbacteria bacterium GW2011_GWA2_42_15]|uniref:Uncharacterized protein n=1 Tax=Candidatus Kuenenbacteria bacterium GW2011_GWA2_42_15 TaxID=1618677 RepID=A0A0G0YUV3_9BACT|nr:MAG: hypothetical protein UV02_C0042G0009 [Candidatus Kuenenbacteria bacterium GW2011_GWA2_42_15]
MAKKLGYKKAAYKSGLFVKQIYFLLSGLIGSA